MIAILDSGVSNLSSVRNGFLRAETETVVVRGADDWERITREAPDSISGVILPGVGAYGDAMFHLRAVGLNSVIRQIAREGRPLLGICLGMQLLFTSSFEHGRNMGIGLLPGDVVRFGGGVKVPHMGWNSLDKVDSSHPLLAGVSVGDYVYFVHSYHVDPGTHDYVLASSTYGGVEVPAVVGRRNVMGAQFHPEKSGEVGEQILRNFVRLSAKWQAGEEMAL
ncbi:imidazole glycerol phosphate synthase subunit HisH [Alicyclobacillus dauci]|uniref:Imidazole glycerol phosphate synthase subunit HisH n=1 Tax=Alicyclobacillus dauci TaxID=1475485 RepID=A0ABY6Z0P2_9BACL|nr:imidazole glycerol phosphate synthase subunit HisH [Alicyclobacillus dauci]WAH35909.1 imidazole glycerol phosphate synthase subunit HisH [Alicyclobacillus dauci]